jgi:hypothetical protein
VYFLGSQHTTELTPIKQFGIYNQGQLGYGNTNKLGDSNGEMSVLGIVNLGQNVTQVSAGDYQFAKLCETEKTPD